MEVSTPDGETVQIDGNEELVNVICQMIESRMLTGVSLSSVRASVRRSAPWLVASFIDVLELTSRPWIMVDLAKLMTREERHLVSGILKQRAMKRTPKVSLQELIDPENSSFPEAASLALLSLGFTKKDIDRWSSDFDPKGMSVGEIVKRGCVSIGRVT